MGKLGWVMSLREEIDIQSKAISTDSYQMSIGELINLYRDAEIDVHPEFQRMYRWNSNQRVKLIESILLGIPLPSIFVGARKDGIWDVIDGVQRLSTIYQFVGILKDDNGELVDPLILESTKHLPSLKDVQWNADDESLSLPQDLKIKFKRARIDITIILDTRDADSKYELFQRLNTGGTNLSEQEVRNCLVIMSNPEFYDLLCELASNRDFNNCVPLSEMKETSQYRIELIIRLLAATYCNDIDRTISDLSPFLDEAAISLSSMESFFDEMKEKFRGTFSLLNRAYGEDSFKRYDEGKGKRCGAFLVGLYQSIATGIFGNYESINEMDNPVDFIKSKTDEILHSQEYSDASVHGVRALDKFRRMSDLGIKVFTR